jgi:hypothetical protein
VHFRYLFLRIYLLCKLDLWICICFDQGLILAFPGLFYKIGFNDPMNDLINKIVHNSFLPFDVPLGPVPIMSRKFTEDHDLCLSNNMSFTTWCSTVLFNHMPVRAGVPPAIHVRLRQTTHREVLPCKGSR